jgi:hypothetical protein
MLACSEAKNTEPAVEARILWQAIDMVLQRQLQKLKPQVMILMDGLATMDKWHNLFRT